MSSSLSSSLSSSPSSQNNDQLNLFLLLLPLSSYCLSSLLSSDVIYRMLNVMRVFTITAGEAGGSVVTGHTLMWPHAPPSSAQTLGVSFLEIKRKKRSFQPDSFCLSQNKEGAWKYLRPSVNVVSMITSEVSTSILLCVYLYCRHNKASFWIWGCYNKSQDGHHHVHQPFLTFDETVLYSFCIA